MARFLLVLAVRVRLKVVNREFTKKHCINIQVYKVWVEVDCAYNALESARLRDPCAGFVIAEGRPRPGRNWPRRGQAGQSVCLINL